MHVRLTVPATPSVWSAAVAMALVSLAAGTAAAEPTIACPRVSPEVLTEGDDMEMPNPLPALDERVVPLFCEHYRQETALIDRAGHEVGRNVAEGLQPGETVTVPEPILVFSDLDNTERNPRSVRVPAGTQLRIVERVWSPGNIGHTARLEARLRQLREPLRRRFQTATGLDYRLVQSR